MPVPVVTPDDQISKLPTEATSKSLNVIQPPPDALPDMKPLSISDQKLPFLSSLFPSSDIRSKCHRQISHQLKSSTATASEYSNDISSRPFLQNGRPQHPHPGYLPPQFDTPMLEPPSVHRNGPHWPHSGVNFGTFHRSTLPSDAPTRK